MTLSERVVGAERDVPDHVPSHLVYDFDYHDDPAFIADPFTAFDAVRNRRVFWSTLYGGHWILTEYKDIRETLQSPEVFSSYPGGLPPHTFWPRKMNPIELDPPEHGKYRSILAPLFTSLAVAPWEGEIRASCASLVESFAAKGTCEFLDEFARPFPTTIFTRFIGLPSEEAGTFLGWADDIIHGHDQPEVRFQAGMSVVAYMVDLIGRRAREQDGDDFVSTLLRLVVDERHLTEDEALDIMVLLFLGGLDTVTAALGFSFRFLATHPEHRRRLAREPKIIPAAVEELLRAHAFVNMARTVTRDVEVFGVPMRAGDRVLTSTGLASRDPSAFAEPATIDFERPVNRHLAFGIGPHRCLGMHLARLELRVALEEFHRRVPDYVIPAGAEIKGHGGDVMGIDALPLSWEPRLEEPSGNSS